MSFTIRTKKPPYYKIRPGETWVRYLRRITKNIIAMYPHARVHGLRYYFDTDFRRHISYRRKKSIRRKREGSFNNKNVKAALKVSLIERDGEKCNGCKIPFFSIDLTIDHIFPLFMGGDSELINLQLLCRPCHNEKTKRDHLYYMRRPKKLYKITRVLRYIVWRAVPSRRRETQPAAS